MDSDKQTTDEPCRFRWNGDDHTDCPRCGGTNIDPVPMVAPLRNELRRINDTIQALRQDVADKQAAVRGGYERVRLLRALIELEENLNGKL